MKGNNQLLEELKVVKHKISWEGFDYCFRHYSSWKDVFDEDFHRLRKGYISGTIKSTELSNYIDNKISELSVKTQ